MPPDGGVEPGPFPRDPHAGQFEWAVLIPGVGSQVVLANGPGGSIFVAGNHNGAIDAGDVHLPAPTGQAIAVLKLDARARPLWGRSLGVGASLWGTNVRSATVTTSGDVVIGGSFVGTSFDAGTGPLPAVGNTEGFVARLDGATGATQWARSFAGGGEDDVSTVAADPWSDDVYVHGEIAAQAVGGRWQPGYAFLDRYDASGLPIWSRQLEMKVSWQHELAVDHLYGPVVTGRYYGSLVVDGFRLTVDPGDMEGNLAVIGFAPDGRARFVRQLFDESDGFHQRLLAAPDGHLYISTTVDESDGIAFDDDHVLTGMSGLDDVALVRLTADGARTWTTVIDAERPEAPKMLAADAEGAVYLLGSCNRAIRFAPVIDCDSNDSFLVSYGPNGDYRWSTYVFGTPGWAQAIAAVPGRSRLLVAGEVLGAASFGGAELQGTGLFVASVVTGPAYANPLPPPPVVTSVVLEGVLDGQLRQGGAGTLSVSGEHLAQIKSVRVGSRDVFVANATNNLLRIPYAAPHGEALGPLRLVLTHPRGQLGVTTPLQITPIVVSQSGTDTGLGTFASPLRLCRDDWSTLARLGDTIQLLAGNYPCEQRLVLRRGVIVKGEGTTQTKLGAIGRPFGPFSVGYGPHGTTQFLQLSFLSSASDGAILSASSVDLSLRDIDFLSLSAFGLRLDRGVGRASLERVRYLDGKASAIYSNGDIQIDGRQVTIQSTISEGVTLRAGRLILRDSAITAFRTAIEIGALTEGGPLPHHLLLERSTLSAYHGVRSYHANVEVFDSELVGIGQPAGGYGIDLVDGSATVARTRIRGFMSGLSRSYWSPDHSGNVDLDQADVAAAGWGVVFGSDRTGALRIRRSMISGGSAALRLWGSFASVDLGTAAETGANALSSSPTGHALLDDRGAVGAPIDAMGTTLNGNSYSGELRGPSSTPDLMQSAANVVRF
ncbi:MAG: hypothetical protein IPI49_24835 [Myxococcales bacterium]|nr:hypothetical protein [Myxococcales bacterium]